MAKFDDITLYVPARNAGATLEECLASIRNLDPAPARAFILLDPNSSDETVHLARASGMEIVEQQKPGLAAARNEAVAATLTAWVASVDADVVVASDWLGRLADQRSLAANLAGICGRTEERIRGVGDLWRALMHPHHWGDAVMLGPFMLISEALMHRESMLKVGGYRQHLTTYGEDSQLSRDLRDAGYRLAYSPFARAAHVRSDRPRGALDLRWNYARPRAQADLEDLSGLRRKWTKNLDFARAAWTRARAANVEALQAMAMVLPVHHAWLDFLSMVKFRCLPAAVAQAMQHAFAQALASACTKPAGASELARVLLPEIFAAHRADANQASALSPEPWPILRAFCQDANSTIRTWFDEVAAAPKAIDPLASATNSEAIFSANPERLTAWANAFGAPVEATLSSPKWPALRPFSPWNPAPNLDAAPWRAQSNNRYCILPDEGAEPSPQNHDSVVRSTIAHADQLPDAWSFVTLPHLERFDDPLAVLAMAATRSIELEVAYTAPDSLDHRTILLAADLAQACARAGLEVISFHTHITTTHLVARRHRPQALERAA